jgi:hypothetical protein
MIICSTIKLMMEGEPFSTKEMRLLFISMIRAEYERQINEGELESQHILAIALEQSLEQAEADVQQGKPLDDFQYLRKLHFSGKQFSGWMKHNCGRFCVTGRAKRYRMNVNQKLDNAYVEQAMAFTSAHKRAQFFFQEELGELSSDLSEAGKVVLAESTAMIDLALKALDEKVDKGVVRLAVSHKFCKILLNKGVHYIEKLVQHGLLKDSEAEEFVEELEHLLEAVISCDSKTHEGELDLQDAGGEETDKHDLRASSLHICSSEIVDEIDKVADEKAEGLRLDQIRES